MYEGILRIIPFWNSFVCQISKAFTIMSFEEFVMQRILEIKTLKKMGYCKKHNEEVSNVKSSVCHVPKYPKNNVNTTLSSCIISLEKASEIFYNHTFWMKSQVLIPSWILESLYVNFLYLSLSLIIAMCVFSLEM